MKKTKTVVPIVPSAETLLKAAAIGDLNVCRQCVENNISIDARDRDGFSSLHYAAFGGHDVTVEFLLESHADISSVDYGKDIRGADMHLLHAKCSTPLHLAAHSGHTSIVSILINWGADTRTLDLDENTPLHRCCLTGQLEVAEFLLQKGMLSDLQQRNKAGMTPLDCMKTSNSLITYLFHRTAPFSWSILKTQYFVRWFYMIQLTENNDLNDHLGPYNQIGYGDLTIADIVSGYVQKYPELVHVKNVRGEVAMDVASPLVREIFRKVLLWHGRYRVTDQRPEYESPTTIVYRVVDEHTLDQHNQPIRVVLKLTDNAYKYRREIRARSYLGGALDENYVVPHIRLHHPLEYEPLLPISSVAVAVGTVENDEDNGDSSRNKDDNGIIDPLPDLPEGRVGSCTGNGEGECTVLSAIRSTAKHWLMPRLQRARARGEELMSDHSNNLNSLNSNHILADIDLDDDGWNQFDEGLGEVAFSQIAQSNLTPPNQEIDIENENRSGSRGSSNGVGSRGSSRGGRVSSINNSGNGLILSKRMAQKMLMTVMPQADRTLLTALKHEHFLVRQPKPEPGHQTIVATGRKSPGIGVGRGATAIATITTGTGAVCMSKVRGVFMQLLDATDHMHDKGYLHGDVCPMNIVHHHNRWKLIDLDASCVLGKEVTGGHSNSTAYAPPEALATLRPLAELLQGMAYLSDTFFTSAYSRIAFYRQIILDYLATRQQLEDKSSDQQKEKSQGKGQEKGSVQSKEFGKDKSSLKDSEKDKNTTPQSTVVVIPLPFPHTLISMILTVCIANTYLRRISLLTNTEAVGQDQEQKNNQGQHQSTRMTTTATTTTVANTSMAFTAPLISDRPLPPLLLLLADLVRVTFRQATLLAHPSYDIWSLGCVLYELCNEHGHPLFEANREDRLSIHQIHTLLAWGQGLDPGLAQGSGLASVKGQGLGANRSKDWLLEDTGKGVNKDKDKEKGVDMRESKLAMIGDPMARNLLWQMLHPQPTLRPTLARIRAHPYFLTPNNDDDDDDGVDWGSSSSSDSIREGVASNLPPTRVKISKVLRLFGEVPLYDVYFSYRRSCPSDKAYVYLLSRLLEERGVSVAPLEDEEEEDGQGMEDGKKEKEKAKDGKTTTTTKTVTIVQEKGRDQGVDKNNSDNDISNSNNINSKDVMNGLFNCRMCISVFSREATNYSLEHIEEQRILHTHPKKLKMMIAAAAAANTSTSGGILPSGRVAGSGVGGVEEGGCNWGDLTVDSRLDRLLLEQRLAGELTLSGLLELGVTPLYVGDYNEQTKLFEPVSTSGCLPPVLPDVVVTSIEQTLAKYMKQQALVAPQIPICTVTETVGNLVNTPEAKKRSLYLEGDRDICFQTTADTIAASLGVDLAELHSLRRQRARQKNKTGISKLKAQLQSLEEDQEEALRRKNMTTEEKLKIRLEEYRELLVAKNTEVSEMRVEVKGLEHDNYSLSKQLEEALAHGKRLMEENEALKIQGPKDKAQLIDEVKLLKEQIDTLNHIFIV